MSSTHRFQPLFPDERAAGALIEQASALVAEGHRLATAAGSLTESLRPILRSMNSYYTNKIEGQQTRPADIERALAKQFDADKKQAHKQRLALAHIGAEADLEAGAPAIPAGLYAPAFVQHIHAELYGRLPSRDRLTDEGEKVVPGALRSGLVTAGLHVAPAAEDIPALLDAWSRCYAAIPGVERAVVGAACAHHRLLWVHPFPDGNGRTARLHTHLVFTALGVSQALWSPLRGMARDQDAYYARLNNADLPRRNDLDGRGALSQEELVRFASWLLELCVDQARFMRALIGLEEFRSRLLDLLRWLSAHPWAIGREKSVVKTEALEALHYVALTGPLDRSRFMAMTGLPERTARRIVASLIDFGVLVSTTSRAPVRFGVPLESLRFLFPRLWPEAEAD